MIVLILVLILLTPNYVIFANDFVGTAGMQFLKLGSDARANSMAGAIVSEADEVDSIYWNPAGLNNLNNIMFAATYNRWIGDINYFYISYVMPLKSNKLGAIGTSITFVDEGSLEDTYNNLSSIDSLNSYDLAISGAYGLKIWQISVGGALRFIRKKILDKSSTGGIVDIGCQMDLLLNKKLKIGMVIKNLGWASKTIKNPDNMPIMYQAGASYKYKLGKDNILWLISSDIGVYDNFVVNFGFEYDFRQLIYLRSGYKLHTIVDDLGAIKGFCFGVGGKIGIFLIDLNWLSFGYLGQSVQSTINIKF